MSVKAFKYFAIQLGGTPQPVYGTWLTAAITPAMVSYANVGGVSGNDNQLTISVNDSTPFLGAQYAVIVDPTTFNSERVLVINPPPNSTSINIQGVQNTHPGGAYGTGSWVAVGDNAQTVYVQAMEANTGPLYIGTKPQMVKTGGIFVIAKILQLAAGTQPNDFSSSRGGPVDTEPLSNYWIDGTTGDQYLPSAGLV